MVVGHIIPPYSTSRIKVVLNKDFVFSGEPILGRYLKVKFKRKGKDCIALLRVINLQTENRTLANAEMAQNATQIEGVKERIQKNDVLTVDCEVLTAFEREGEIYRRVNLDTIINSLEDVEFIDENLINQIISRIRHDVFYLGRAIDENFDVPLVFQPFYVLNEAYHILIAGQTGSGKSTEAKKILVAYAKSDKQKADEYARKDKTYRKMNFLILDPVGEFAKSFRGEDTGHFPLNLGEIWESLGKSQPEIYGIDEIALDRWDMLEVLMKKEELLKTIAIKHVDNQNIAIDIIKQELKTILKEKLRRKLRGRLEDLRQDSQEIQKIEVIELLSSLGLGNVEELQLLFNRSFPFPLEGQPIEIENIMEIIENNSDLLLSLLREISVDDLFSIIGNNLNRIYTVPNKRSEVLSAMEQTGVKEEFREKWSNIIAHFDISNGKKRIKSIVKELTQNSGETIIIDLSRLDWENPIKFMIIYSIFSTLIRAGEDAYRENDMLNTLVVIDEAHRIAPAKLPSDAEEYKKRTKEKVVTAFRETRKLGIGWMVISTRISNLDTEIWEHARVKLFGFGLSTGKDADLLKEHYGKDVLEIYKQKIGDPYDLMSERVHKFMIDGPVNVISKKIPEFYEAYNSVDEFLEKNGLDILSQFTS